MRPSPTPTGDASGLWYELGRLYAVAGEDRRRTVREGFVVAFVTAALVLLSAPLFGTSWAGPFAALIPVAAGLLFGGGSLGWRRPKFFERREALRRPLAAQGKDAERSAASGLDAYYDAQLVLLRSEYEFLRSQETGAPFGQALRGFFRLHARGRVRVRALNVTPDTPKMLDLRERWDAWLAARRSLGEALPPLGLREDAHYRVFPREMTVPAELATRSAYLAISHGLLRKRYGKRLGPASEEVRRRAERDLREYRALVRR